jgi:phospholipase/carboxylesterase
MTVLPDPHAPQTVLTAGEALETAKGALLLIHGRGAAASDMLGLAAELDTSGLACLAPQAAGNTWYPHRFLAPTASNQPWLGSALAKIDQTIKSITQAGIPLERVILLGFSQGACLATEYAARHARRYGALIGLSGGLIGADGEPRQDKGNLEGTPVFLGCSDIDPHIPLQRLHLTAQVLHTLGGTVDTRIYANLGHTVNSDELDAVQRLLYAVVAPALE